MSYAQTIGEAVVAIIGGLAGPPGKVVLRKVDSLLKTDTPFPVVVVTEAQELPLGGQAFGGTIIRNYRIGISVYRRHGGNVQTDTDAVPSLTLAIQQALHTGTLAGAPTVCDTELTPFGYFEPGGFASGYEVARCAMVFSSAESRTG